MPKLTQDPQNGHTICPECRRTVSKRPGAAGTPFTHKNNQGEFCPGGRQTPKIAPNAQPGSTSGPDHHHSPELQVRTEIAPPEAVPDAVRESYENFFALSEAEREALTAFATPDEMAEIEAIVRQEIRGQDWTRDPVGWVETMLEEFMYSKQREICQSVIEHRYTAVPSCHDAGKSYTASRIVSWWLDAHPPGEAFVVTTAPTSAQVEAILWREIGRAHKKGDLFGRVTLDAKWYLTDPRPGSPDELVAYGRKPADYDMAAFQGIHARYVLIVIDEACGVPKILFDAVDSLATNERARVLAIGNPDDPNSHFATICRPGSGWNVLHISAFDTPNFTDEAVPEALRELWISRTWVEERRKRWGEGSPLYVAKVLGQFPKESKDVLIQMDWITAATLRDIVPDMWRAAFGLDVARYGADDTVMFLNQGGHVRETFTAQGNSIVQTAERAMLEVGSVFSRPPVRIDDVGVGGGVTDIMQSHGYGVMPLNGGSAATEKLRDGRGKFVNARSEWYWNLREQFRLGLIDIDPADEELIAQLSDIHWGVARKGQIYVETKDDMRKRGVSSPDRADGVCYAAVPIDAILASGDSHQDPYPGMTGDLLETQW